MAERGLKKRAGATVGLLLAASGALAPAPASGDMLVQYRGHVWETGSLPPSVAGDVLNFVAVADSVDPIFTVDMNTHELTVWLGGLVSTGQTNLGGGFVGVTYADGPIEFWLDPARDHAFGTAPPNATAPSTFRNGTLFLSGVAKSMFVFLDTTFGTGAFEVSEVAFDAGSALNVLLEHVNGAVLQFGGVLDTAASGGNPPPGYDYQVFGGLDAIEVDAVTPVTWGRVKALYQAR